MTLIQRLNKIGYTVRSGACNHQSCRNGISAHAAIIVAGQGAAGHHAVITVAGQIGEGTCYYQSGTTGRSETYSCQGSVCGGWRWGGRSRGSGTYNYPRSSATEVVSLF